MGLKEMKKYNFNHERHEKHENKTEIFVSVYLRRTQKHADLFFTFPLSCVFVLFVIKRLLWAVTTLPTLELPTILFIPFIPVKTGFSLAAY